MASICFRILFITLLGLALPLRAATLTFGVGPQQSASELAKRWVPVLEYLSGKTGLQLRFQTARDIPMFQQEMNAGRYDIAYINPVHYIIFHRSSGYQAFARDKDSKLTGVLVARRQSVRSLEDLRGMPIAFPSPTAIAATAIPLAHLNERQIQIEPRYVVSMDSVYRAVAKGMFVAGGGEMRTLSMLDPQIRDQLEVVWQADPLPPFLFAAHPRVTASDIAKLRNAMEGMHTDPRGAALLKSIGFSSIGATSDGDYAAMRTSPLVAAIERQAR